MNDKLSKAIWDKGSVRQAARDLDIHVNTLSKYMDGAVEPGVKKAIKIAEYVGMPVEVLFGDGVNIDSTFNVPVSVYNAIFKLGVTKGENVMRQKMMELIK